MAEVPSVQWPGIDGIRSSFFHSRIVVPFALFCRNLRSSLLSLLPVPWPPDTPIDFCAFLGDQIYRSRGSLPLYGTQSCRSGRFFAARNKLVALCGCFRPQPKSTPMLRKEPLNRKWSHTGAEFLRGLSTLGRR